MPSSPVGPARVRQGHRPSAFFHRTDDPARLGDDEHFRHVPGLRYLPVR